MNTSTSLLRRAAKPSKIDFGTKKATTPPMTTRPRASSIDSCDEEYFSKTYVPLSNLPTPPLSSHSNSSSRQISPELLFSPTEYLDPELLGPAIHLTNLIPISTSLTPPSSSLVHAILTRASLPLETIALAVSILDSLNTRFALQWRKSCPIGTSTHIDSIHPELIPLTALILAHKFADDVEYSTREYVNNWAKGLWSCAQVNDTQWCLMDNLGGRLLPLWDEGVILSALEDMERAGRAAVKERESGRVFEEGWEIVTKESLMIENVKGVKVGISVEEKRMVRRVEESATKEPFQSFVDPGMGLNF